MRKAAFDLLEENVLSNLDDQAAFARRFMHNYNLFSTNQVMERSSSQMLIAGHLEEYAIWELHCLRDELEFSTVAAPGVTAFNAGCGVQVYMAPRV
jgi:hypothetical protein